MSGSDLDDDDIEALAARYQAHPQSLEWKLLAAFLQCNECWHCQASLCIDEHPHCKDCPEWDETAEPASPTEVSH